MAAPPCESRCIALARKTNIHINFNPFFLNDAILQMHLNKSSKSFVRHGTESYLVEFEGTSFDTSEMRCYNFTIGILNNTSVGIGCVKNNESVEIIYSSSN